MTGPDFIAIEAMVIPISAVASPVSPLRCLLMVVRKRSEGRGCPLVGKPQEAATLPISSHLEVLQGDEWAPHFQLQGLHFRVAGEDIGGRNGKQGRVWVLNQRDSDHLANLNILRWEATFCFTFPDPGQGPSPCKSRDPGLALFPLRSRSLQLYLRRREGSQTQPASPGSAHQPRFPWRPDGAAFRSLRAGQGAETYLSLQALSARHASGKGILVQDDSNTSDRLTDCPAERICEVYLPSSLPLHGPPVRSENTQMNPLPPIQTGHSPRNEADMPQSHGLKLLRAKCVTYYESIGILEGDSSRNGSQSVLKASQDTQVNPTEHQTFRLRSPQALPHYLANGRKPPLLEVSEVTPGEAEQYWDQRAQ
uniref:uncharacterized protein LOC114672648 n=1 Tax=Macaca mulatta TaxID=9544 RepID=UPI0010A20374|nr:uncharacterized protein LOC114672648 [Macaca mulatta]